MVIYLDKKEFFTVEKLKPYVKNCTFQSFKKVTWFWRFVMLCLALLMFRFTVIMPEPPPGIDVSCC